MLRNATVLVRAKGKRFAPRLGASLDPHLRAMADRKASGRGASESKVDGACRRHRPRGEREDTPSSALDDDRHLVPADKERRHIKHYLIDFSANPSVAAFSSSVRTFALSRPPLTSASISSLIDTSHPGSVVSCSIIASTT